MSSAALYQKPELLSAETHRAKKITTFTQYDRTAGMHAVFLTATEFARAVNHFPVIFIDSGEKNAAGKAIYSPVALLGVTPGENLMVEGARWTGGYVPAFIRRYPFLSAVVPGGDKVSVFVDTDWAGFNDAEGDALFNEQGEPTDTLKNAIEFMQRFDMEAERTRAFCDLLAELDLLESMNANLTLPGGETMTVDGFFAVNEEKLNQLADDKVLQLHKNGALTVIYAHLMSLAAMSNLVERKATRLASQAAASTAAEPAATAEA